MAWKITERDSPRGPVLAHGIKMREGSRETYRTLQYATPHYSTVPGHILATGVLLDGKLHDELELTLPATIDWVETPAS